MNRCRLKINNYLCRIENHVWQRMNNRNLTPRKVD